MKVREDRSKVTLLTCAGIAAGVIIIVAVLAAIWFLTPLGKPVPTVQIVQPADAMSIDSGDGILIWASGESRNGFEEFLLLVDDQLIEQQLTSDPRERNPVTSFNWFSSQPGIHKISIVGINNSDRASQPDNILVVVNPRNLALLPQEISEDSSVEGDNDTQEDNDSDDDPGGLESAGDQGDEADADGSASDPSGIEVDPGSNGEDAVDGADLDLILDDVDMDGDFPIDLPNQPDDEIPVISLFHIQESSDGGGLNVNYRIRATDDIGLAILHLEIRSMDQQWQPQHEEFACLGETICNQDGNIQLPHGGWLLSAQALDTSGQTSEILSAQIHTLDGNDPPAIAMGEFDGNINLVAQQDEAEVIELIDQVYDIGQPSLSSYGCSGQIVNLEVPYVYNGENGEDVYLGATAEKDNVMVAAGHTRIQQGIGIAHIEMEAIAPDLIDQTDELELYFRTGADYFYQETADLQITWPIPEPDLMITYISQAEALLNVHITNMGCSSVQGFDLRFQLADGRVVDTTIDQPLAPGITYVLENFYVSANLFSMGFEALVDPYDQIKEINEENNQYSLDPISVKHVHITRIDILTVHENLGRGDRGEYQFYAKINDSVYVSRPAGEDTHFSLGKGVFEFETIVINVVTGQVYSKPYIVEYPVNWYENLLFRFAYFEDDGFAQDTDHADVQLDLSSDFSDEKCWKSGGEFSATSSTGGIDYFTVYFDVVLNER